jgi:hypothetical protein
MKTISSVAPMLLLIFACRLCSLSGNTVNPNNLNPYKGSVQDLIPKELSVGLVKYKLDTSQSTHFKGATEAFQANYTMQAGSISVQIQLVVANFPSSQGYCQVNGGRCNQAFHAAYSTDAQLCLSLSSSSLPCRDH